MRIRDKSLKGAAEVHPARRRRLSHVLGLAAAITLSTAGAAVADIPASWTDGSATWYVTNGWEATNCPMPLAIKPGLVNAAANTPTAKGSYANPKIFGTDELKRAVTLTRKSAYALSSTEKATLKLAWSLIQALPDTDPRSMIRMAGTHCIYCGNDWLNDIDKPATGDIHAGPANGQYFLPFHRAFLYSVEEVLRALLLKDAGADGPKKAAAEAFALPYWDWTSRAMDAMYLPGGGATALPSVTGNLIRDLSSRTRRTLAANWGEQLAKEVPATFFSTSVSFSGTHVTAHNDAKGWMQNPLHSARTPVFYAHHGNVDRMWDAWTTKKKANKSPKTTTIKPSSVSWGTVSMIFPNGKGEWVSFTSASVDEISKLGYIYK